jgi:hypothetical protein
MKRPPGKKPGNPTRRSSQASVSRKRPPARLVEAIILVTRYRFMKFREAFGRTPAPSDPLFFEEGLPYPALAGEEQLMNQITQAAQATGVDLKELKTWLRLR